jgi:alcohol dehydrogenase (cytochrome c)
MQLEGLHLAPALTGERFHRAWGGKTADTLMFQLRRMPPQQRPGQTLGEATYTAILAFLLQANGSVPGDTPLPLDAKALASLTIPRLGPATADLDAPVTRSAVIARRLSGLTPVTDAMLHNPPGGDWLQWGRTYDGQNYSPLKLITSRNIDEVRPAWRTPLRAGTSMPTPIVHNGLIFLQTIPDTVLAIDGANGDILWRFQYKAAPLASRKMGLALHGNRVFVPTSDLHVVALNARTGELAWDHHIESDAPVDGRAQLQLRSAPLVVKDKVIQG